MATDDQGARRSRADALRQQIDKLKGGGAAPATPATPPSAPPPAPSEADREETPAEFVHRRMRELDKKKDS